MIAKRKLRQCHYRELDHKTEYLFNNESNLN